MLQDIINQLGYLSEDDLVKLREVVNHSISNRQKMRYLAERLWDSKQNTKDDPSTEMMCSFVPGT